MQRHTAREKVGNYCAFISTKAEVAVCVCVCVCGEGGVGRGMVNLTGTVCPPLRPLSSQYAHVRTLRLRELGRRLGAGGGGGGVYFAREEMH